MVENVMPLIVTAGTYRHFIKAAYLLLIVLSLSAFWGCNSGSGSAQNYIPDRVSNPNIIWIVVDTLRADHLSTYGYARNTDPNIAEFSKQAMVFQHAYSAAPWTLPSFTSMLLGKYAFNHSMNVPYSQGSVLSEHVLPKLLKDRGYLLVSFQSNPFLRNLDSDFDVRYHLFTTVTGTASDSSQSQINFNAASSTIDSVVADDVIGWLDDNAASVQRMFLFVGFLSPHFKYYPHPAAFTEFYNDKVYLTSPAILGTTDTQTDFLNIADFPKSIQSLVGAPADGSTVYKDSRIYVAAYDSEIAYADDQIGRLLQTLKDKNLFDNSLIIITADHGENMTDHTKYFRHGGNLFNAALSVPLLIKLPNQTRSRTISSNVMNCDVMPTALDYVGLTVSKDCKSLLPMMNNDANYDNRPILSYRVDSDNGEKMVSVIDNGYKLIRGEDTSMLFNLLEDPAEQSNIISQENTDKVTQLDNIVQTYYPY